MTMASMSGIPIKKEILSRYFDRLVNKIFKILPMRENEEASLNTYVQSLQTELMGLQEFVHDFGSDADFITILSILQYIIDHPECSLIRIRREIFHAISTCNKIQSRL